MTKVAIIAKDLASIADVFEEQRKAGLDVLASETDILNDLIAKCGRLTDLDMEGVKELTTVVNAGPWSSSSRKALSHAIAERHRNMASGKLPSRDTQQCAIELFYTNRDHDHINDPDLPMERKRFASKQICESGSYFQAR